MHTAKFSLALLATVALAACGDDHEPAVAAATPRAADRAVVAVRDTLLPGTLDVTGVAEPVREATLSTRLMGSILDVPVREGDRVAAGQVLARIDGRDLAAKGAQVDAGISAAEAMHADALVNAERIRSLYADSAATKAQLDAVEAGLRRAEAGLAQARAAKVELDAVRDYATVQAPFAGLVTKRHVDPGAFAAPGAPIVSVQDDATLRIRVQVSADAVRGLVRGAAVPALIGGISAPATVEGVVPAGPGNLFVVNATVANRDGRFLAGSPAALQLPQGERRTLVVPAAAIERDGDLVGVTLRTANGDIRRWVRLGAVSGDLVEIAAGLKTGDQVLLPAAAPRLTAER